MAKLAFWKIWLRPNLLNGQDGNGLMANVSTLRRTMKNEDLARRIVESRSELHYETILSVLGQRDAAVEEFLMKGAAVQDGNVRLVPRVTGVWSDPDQAFDPGVHKVTVDALPTASLLRTLAERVGVEVLGRKADGGATIGLVTDVGSGRHDGFITSGGDIVIDGRLIKIAPPEPPCGVFFVDADGEAIPLDRPIAMNNPRKIICAVPAAVKQGVYTLRILTRYPNGGGRLMKEPRILEYGLPLHEGVP
ncbi:MAG: DUF4469 domain-containing protein [Tannerellaceae bacterium]|jgi:hypothetical protein|nr:DUF4469 domain-containing protein [Tannerellaceae bacterium]